MSKPILVSNNNSPNKLISTQNQPSGIFTWILATDTVYCDGLVASSFGFSPTEVQLGLPIKAFLDRIHPDDLRVVGKAIRDAIISGQPYQEEYRVCRPDGTTVTVTAFGSCFRDMTGEPSHYSGMVVPIEADSADQENLIDLCMRAHRVAKDAGQYSVMEKLIDILRELTSDTEANADFGNVRVRH